MSFATFDDRVLVFATFDKDIMRGSATFDKAFLNVIMSFQFSKMCFFFATECLP